jgi:hypothetical protein
LLAVHVIGHVEQTLKLACFSWDPLSKRSSEIFERQAANAEAANTLLDNPPLEPRSDEFYAFRRIIRNPEPFIAQIAAMNAAFTAA